MNLCAHSCTRAILVRVLLDMIKPVTEGPAGRLTTVNSQRLYGCQSNVVYGRSQLLDGNSPPQKNITWQHFCESSFFFLCVAILFTSLSFTGLPPLVLRRILEILTYLATNHSAVANILFYFDPLLIPESSNPNFLETKKDKGKEKIVEGDLSNPVQSHHEGDVPLILLLKLLNQPLFLRSIAHLEQVCVCSL